MIDIDGRSLNYQYEHSQLIAEVSGCDTACYAPGGGLTRGMQLIVTQQGKAIELVPVPTLEELQVDLKGCGSVLEDEVERF